ncbi:MAG TPA: type II toxin-antitoxin system MqsR family toxin [Longimicrobiaceae bacterium]
MPRKNPPDPPNYALAEIQAAVQARNYYFGKPARQRLAMGKWTVEDAESWVAQLTPAHFYEAGVTTDPANPGQKFDVYKLPVEAGRVMYMKFELLATGAVEIISLHRTDK